MVDSIGPSGQTQNVSQVNKTQKSLGEQKFDEIVSRAADEVTISEEAILLQAESTAKQASEQLLEDPLTTLSSGVERLDALA